MENYKIVKVDNLLQVVGYDEFVKRVDDIVNSIETKLIIQTDDDLEKVKTWRAETNKILDLSQKTRIDYEKEMLAQWAVIKKSLIEQEKRIETAVKSVSDNIDAYTHKKPVYKYTIVLKSENKDELEKQYNELYKNCINVEIKVKKEQL